MAKFRGIVGYAHASVESKPGVWTDVIVEKMYKGNVIANTRRLDEVEKVNMDISVGNSVSIVSNTYANEHIFAIRFIEWAGVCWTVTDVKVERPRLLLRLGGVYNGPRAAPSGSP